VIERLGGKQEAVAACGLGVALAAGAVLALTKLGVLACNPAYWYWITAFGSSVFSGFASLAVWRQQPPSDAMPLWPWYVHKWSFNGIGSFAGWYAAFYLRKRVWLPGHGLDVGDFVLALVALLGINGWLPYTVVAISHTLGSVATKLLGSAGPKE
jgi:hypothetical protein